MRQRECASSADSLRVARYFLLNLSRLKDALSFLRWGGERQTEEGADQSGDYRRQSATARSTELPEQRTLRCTYLDNHHLNGDVVRQSDRRSEVLGQRHQQVQDGDDTLRVDGWRAEGKQTGQEEKKNCEEAK